MNYEYVHIEEETNLKANFKKQLEIHNKKALAEIGREHLTDSEFDKVLIHLEGGTRFEKAKKLRDLYPLETEDGQRVRFSSLTKRIGVRMSFVHPTKSLLKVVRNAVMMSLFSSMGCHWCKLSLNVEA